ncbi:WD40-repeat-containing domain protein [Mycena leptocephala]|nr:WD40-repeat-containing domain protein [Mycena leptocephala]
MPVAELMFGKQGPPKVSPSFAATFSIPSVNCTPASTSGSRTASLKPQPQATASHSVADDERTVASRPSGAFGADLDHPIPVAELMFGKQGPPKSSSAFAATSVSTPSMNCTPASTSGSRTPPTQTTASNPITGDERVVLNRTSRDHPTRPSKPSSSIAAASVSIPSWIVKPAPLQTQTQAIASNTQSLSLSNKVQFGEEPLSESFQPTSSANTLHIPSTRLPSPSRDLESSLSDYTWEPDGDEFRVPIRQQHDKLRRFLCGTTPSSSVVVSMYGAVENVDVASRKHRLIAQGPSPTKEAVDDACLVTDGNRSVVILGHFRDSQQLSLININNLDNMVSAIDLKRPWNPAKKGGASTVAPMMQPLMFASGGYDHCVHLWTVKDDLSSASPTTLSIKHASQVQSLLAIRDTSHKLVSAGADCNVHIWDLSSERVVHTLKPSNSIYHTHPTTSPFCTLLEVAHRELQFEVRDHRIVNTIPVQRFGYTTLQVHGRFMKGSSFSNCFVSGDKSGYARLWDLRNIKKPCAEIECFNGQKIAQLVFQSESSRLLACSENNQIRLVKHNRPI